MTNTKEWLKNNSSVPFNLWTLFPLQTTKLIRETFFFLGILLQGFQIKDYLID